MSGVYDDILHLARPQSKKHRPMPMEDRAAQFFALCGTHRLRWPRSRRLARLTEDRIELDPQEAERLGTRLAVLVKRQQEQPELSLLYYVPDARKAGGRLCDGKRAAQEDNGLPEMYIPDGREPDSD